MAPGGLKPRNSKSMSASQHISHHVNSNTSNEINKAIAPGGLRSLVNQAVANSQRKPTPQSKTNSHSTVGSQHAIYSHSSINNEPPSMKASHNMVNSNTGSHRVYAPYRAIDAYNASSSQPVDCNITNDSNTRPIEEPSEKKGRKKAQNKALRDFIGNGGGRPKIEILIGKTRPLGKWRDEWVSELGIIVTQNIPLTFHYWKELKDEHKLPLYTKVLEKFDVDTTQEHVRDAIDSSLKDRFKARRHKLHCYYLILPEDVNKLDHPEKTVTQIEWQSLCKHFESEKFKKRSETNKRNREKPRMNHRGGRKSFVCHRFDQRDPETGIEPDVVEFYRNMRWSAKKGWIAPEAEENYEKMLEIRSQPLEEGDLELTDTQIVEKVLGKQSGYVMGLGHGELPPSSRRCRVARDEQEIRQFKLRVEEQDKELNELRAWKASQEELIKTQQEQIETQAQQQQETNLILNALKDKLVDIGITL